MPCAIYSFEINENWMSSVTALYTFFTHVCPILFVRVTDGKQKSKLFVLSESGNEMLCRMAWRVLWHRKIGFELHRDQWHASEKPVNR